MNRQQITIRCSALPSYNDCPRRASCRIIASEIEAAGYALRTTPPSIGAAIGTGAHAGADQIVWECAPLDAAEDAAIEALRESVAAGVVWDATTPHGNASEVQVRRQVAAFREHHAATKPDTKSARPERISAPVGDGLVDFQLSGKKDIRSGHTIRDWKFGSLLRPYHAQLGGYSLLDRLTTSRPSALDIVHVPRVSIRSTQRPAAVVRYDVAASERAAWYVVQQIMKDITAFLSTGSPHEFAANPMSMMCSDKYCPAHGTEWCEITKQG